MPFCPNSECTHLKRLGEPAEFKQGISQCSDCGSSLTETIPAFVSESKRNKQEKPESTGWTCPECGHVNRDETSLCVCGNDINRPNFNKLSDAWKVVGWKCPKCGLTNHRDLVRCTCGYDPSEIEASQKELSVQFKGSSREYFRIWIVNLCLTLLTLGIFSAWAKVRKKRYFYSHTIIDGTPFQYLGQPIPILKGRIIATIVFLAYYSSSHFFTSLLPYVFGVGALLTPWVIVRSTAFNARYSSFRNMTFDFDGGYRDALKALYALGFIPILALGMMFEWRGKAFIVPITMALLGFSFPWWLRRLKNFLISHTSYGGKKGVFNATGAQFFWVYFRSGLIMVGVMFIGMIFVGIVASIKDKTHSQFVNWTTLAIVYSGYVLAYAYVQARSSNLVWNNTSFGSISFRSTLLGWELTKLYVTNALAIIASVGMLIPWAVMRTLKYRVDNVQIIQSRDLTEFHGNATRAVDAIGSETLDFFDMDISL